MSKCNRRLRVRAGGRWHWIICLFLFLLLGACQQTGSTPQATVVMREPEPDVVATAVAGTVAARDHSTPPTEPALPEATVLAATVPAVTVPAATEPVVTTVAASPTAAVTIVTCTVQQALNFRHGPGTAYSPPIRTLATGTTLIAQTYTPAGSPGGAWLQVTVEGTNETGWVSAGAQYVACTADPASLPHSASIPATPTVAAPPSGQTPTTVVSAPAAPRTRNSLPDGAFPADHVVWELRSSDNYLFRFIVYDTYAGNRDGAGIVSVKFVISNVDGVVYRHTERVAGYCIFGGGEPDCQPWPYENGSYRWGRGGPAVTPGEYFASIYVTPATIDPSKNATADPEDPVGNPVWGWFFPFTVDVP
jgi:hypothetical protein